MISCRNVQTNLCLEALIYSIPLAGNSKKYPRDISATTVFIRIFPVVVGILVEYEGPDVLGMVSDAIVPHGCCAG